VPGSQVTTTVSAPIDLVWKVLVDVQRMPQWTSSMRSVQILDGSVLGTGTRVRVKQPWLLAATWKVDLFDPPRQFTWSSRTGLVTTVGSHLLEDHGPATVATLGIEHSGPGAGAVALLFGPLTRDYVNRESSGLKRRTEELANASGR